MTARPRLLLISPRFFGYERDIAAAFERRGFDVTFVDERPSNGSVARALFRIGSGLLRRSVDRYYRRIAAGTTTGFDLVLVVKGEVVPRWFLESVREGSPHAVFAFYTFDAVANSPALEAILDLFDRRYSFEPDAVAADVALDYKPLFYGRGFAALPAGRARDYDIAFVGTLHSDRYRLVRRVAAAVPRAFVYLYVQARWFLLVQRVRDARLRAVRASEVGFVKLEREAVADVFRRSIAVLDMQHERQRGLTIRSFEAIASGAYLVTTNPLAESQLGPTGRVITIASDPSDAEVAALADRLRSLPVPDGAPDGFERHSVDAWVGDFVELVGA